MGHLQDFQVCMTLRAEPVPWEAQSGKLTSVVPVFTADWPNAPDRHIILFSHGAVHFIDQNISKFRGF